MVEAINNNLSYIYKKNHSPGGSEGKVLIIINNKKKRFFK